MSVAVYCLLLLAGVETASSAEGAVAAAEAVPFNGGPLRAIVVPPDASPGERFAASECRRCLQQATGGEVEIFEAAEPPQGRAILVGRRLLPTGPQTFSRSDRCGPDPYVVEITDYTWKTMWEQNPWPIARRLARDIRYLRQNHFVGFFSQGGEGAWGQLGVNFYVMAKALWDPECDTEAILDDYFRHAFGPAREPMKRYYDTIEAAFSAKGNFIHHVAPLETRQILKPQVVAACDAAIEDAYARAPDEVIRRRIELVDLPYRYAKHFRAAHDAHSEWTQTGSSAALGRAVSEMTAAVALCKENAAKDALSTRLADGVSDRYLKRWKAESLSRKPSAPSAKRPR